MNCLILCNQDDRELLIKKFINRNYNQTIHFTFIKTLEDIFNIVRNRRFPVEFLLIQLIHDADFLQSLQKRSIGTFARFLATALSSFRGLPLPICAARWNLPLKTGRLKARSISLPRGRAPIWNWRAQARD